MNVSLENELGWLAFGIWARAAAGIVFRFFFGNLICHVIQRPTEKEKAEEEFVTD
jgi:hypothetical protein